jgi:hypothetical protein
VPCVMMGGSQAGGNGGRERDSLSGTEQDPESTIDNQCNDDGLYSIRWYCMTCGDQLSQSERKKKASYSIAHDFTSTEEGRVACHWHLSNARSMIPPAKLLRMAYNADLRMAVLWQYSIIHTWLRRTPRCLAGFAS